MRNKNVIKLIIVALSTLIPLIIVIAWQVRVRQAERATEEAARVVAEKSKAKAAGIVKFYYCFTLPPNRYVGGQNVSKPDERTAELIETGNANLLYFDLPYYDSSVPQRQRFRLQKMGNSQWKGTFEQESPAEHGEITLNETVPGKIYTGTQTWMRRRGGNVEVGETAHVEFKIME